MNETASIVANLNLLELIVHHVFLRLEQVMWRVFNDALDMKRLSLVNLKAKRDFQLICNVGAFSTHSERRTIQLWYELNVHWPVYHNQFRSSWWKLVRVWSGLFRSVPVWYHKIEVEHKTSLHTSQSNPDSQHRRVFNFLLYWATRELVLTKQEQTLRYIKAL